MTDLEKGAVRLPADRLSLPDSDLAAWLSSEAAIIASGLDHAHVVTFARTFSDALAAGRVEIRAVSKPVLANGEPFRGRPMQARFPGRCAVCSKRIAVDASIVFNSELKQAAHLGCGQLELKRGRHG